MFFQRNNHWQLWAAAFLIAVFLPPSSSILRAQAPVNRGTISGTVTADQGDVRAFRVTAHNLQYKVWYTVFTNKGHYTIPQALPGLYNINVWEPGYDSPALPVQLGPGESKSLDLTLKKRVTSANAGAGAMPDSETYSGGRGQVSANTIYYNTMDEFYPPGPGRDLLRANCTGCHGAAYGTMHLTKEGYRAGIARMTETGPTDTPNSLNLGRTAFTGAEKDQIAEYLAKNFGPDVPDKRLRTEPVVIDEAATSKAIFVAYDAPPDMPIAPRGSQLGADMIEGVTAQAPAPTGPRGTTPVNYLHDPYISPIDGSIWFGAPVANSILRVDPRELDPIKRWKIWPLKGTPFVFIHGIAMDKEGRVYWAEIRGGQLGELDPATGQQIRHTIPAPGAMLQVVVDKDDNVWFCNVKGATMGYLDAKTRKIHTFPTPTPDNGLYGLAADRQGNIFAAGWQKGIVTKWDRETQSIVEYKVPNSWGIIRRIGVDSKGTAWFSEWNAGLVGALDPTGKITEYKLPGLGAEPYDVWPDKDDDIWIIDTGHATLVKLDKDTKKFTSYPLPLRNSNVPKIEIEANKTIWFGARGAAQIAANHFYPNGYTVDAPPEP